MKQGFIIILLMVCALNVSAQTYLEHLQTHEAGKGNVTVHQSRDIDILVNGKSPMVITPKKSVAPKQKRDEAARKDNSTSSRERIATRQSPLEEDTDTETETIDTSKKVMRGAQKVSGYRVQVYAGGNSRTDKNKAESIGNQIKSIFPGQPVYVHFYSPRWICRMGNFRTYEEGKAMLNRVRAVGFNQASLVKGQISVTNY